MRYQIIIFLFAGKGVIYFVTIATVIFLHISKDDNHIKFSLLKIYSCKITSYFFGVKFNTS